MNTKFRTSIFFLVFFGFLCVPYCCAAAQLDFYSKIDDAGDTLSQGITKRYLQDYGSFKNFGTECRQKIPWLDTENIDQEMLEELSRKQYTKFVNLLKNKNQEQNYPVGSDQFLEITGCLEDSYKNVKRDSAFQQESLEDAGGISIFMDGSSENSDFDIITDIEKINEIVFKHPKKYEGDFNPTAQSLKKFLQGKKAPKLLEKPKEKIENNTGNNSGNSSSNSTGSNSQSNNSSTSSQQNSTPKTPTKTPRIPWSESCKPDDDTNTQGGTKTKDIKNLIDGNFSDDLNRALSGNGSTQNKGVDYSQNTGGTNTNNGTDKDNQDTEKKNTENNSKKDFFNKLPCSGIFCITIGTNIKNHNLLNYNGGGRNDPSIEEILEAHIKKMEPVSWADLSGQKMTQNSFQIPFLNIKFKNKIAGARIFMHNSPQITKKLEEENTPEKKEADFDKAYRCSVAQAQLSTIDTQNGGHNGAGFRLNAGHTSENFQNATIPVGPLEESQIMALGDCGEIFSESTRNVHYDAFATQINEVQAFTDAILDVIRQILDTEMKLDNVKVQ